MELQPFSWLSENSDAWQVVEQQPLLVNSEDAGLGAEDLGVGPGTATGVVVGLTL